MTLLGCAVIGWILLIGGALIGFVAGAWGTAIPILLLGLVAFVRGMWIIYSVSRRNDA